jgi:CBS domain-containing protein
MSRAYSPLPVVRVPHGAGFCAPQQALAEHVGPDAPALAVMTDLTRVSAVLTRPSDTIDEALARMKQRGVRLLLVVDGERHILGLITANDILAEKPLRYVEAHGVRHQEILVEHIMTRCDEMEAIPIASVKGAKVGHVVATLRASGRQHTLVVEADGGVRGIFSATQIARQLGVDPQSINAGEIAHTFSEMEAMLAR